jgi:hypothetical protein
VLPEILPKVAVMVVEPAAIDVASPAVLIVATPVFEELHVTDDVISFVVLSEYVPVAVNCCVAPVAMLALAGATVMETSVGCGRELVENDHTGPGVELVELPQSFLATIFQ